MKPAQTAEEALKERQRTIANYRRLKKAEWLEAVAREPVLEDVEMLVRKCRDPAEMVGHAMFAAHFLPKEDYQIALSLFARRISQIRQRQGLDPFDDPLPPQLAAAGSEEDHFDCWQTVRGILT